MQNIKNCISFCRTFCKSFGKTLAQISTVLISPGIWTFATILSLPKMLKIYRDPDIPKVVYSQLSESEDYLYQDKLSLLENRYNFSPGFTTRQKSTHYSLLYGIVISGGLSLLFWLAGGWGDLCLKIFLIPIPTFPPLWGLVYKLTKDEAYDESFIHIIKSFYYLLPHSVRARYEPRIIKEFRIQRSWRKMRDEPYENLQIDDNHRLLMQELNLTNKVKAIREEIDKVTNFPDVLNNLTISYLFKPIIYRKHFNVLVNSIDNSKENKENEFQSTVDIEIGAWWCLNTKKPNYSIVDCEDIENALQVIDRGDLKAALLNS